MAHIYVRPHACMHVRGLRQLRNFVTIYALQPNSEQEAKETE